MEQASPEIRKALDVTVLASGFFGILLPEVLSTPATGLPAPYLDTAKLEAKRSLFFSKYFLLGSKANFPKVPPTHSHRQYQCSVFLSLLSQTCHHGQLTSPARGTKPWMQWWSYLVGIQDSPLNGGQGYYHYPLKYVREVWIP